MVKLTDEYEKALNLAFRCHQGQYRKSTTVPYISHPLAVSTIVLELGGNEKQAITALLHDVLEDCEKDELLEEFKNNFSSEILAKVQLCSEFLGDREFRDQKSWQERKKNYLKQISKVDTDTLLIVFADKYHNLSCIFEDYLKLEDKLWDRFNSSAKDILWYYGELFEIFSEKLDVGNRLDEMELMLAELEEMIDGESDNIEILSQAQSLYRERKFQDLFELCKAECKDDLNNLELWKLYGVAAGMIGSQNIARICAETIYKLDPSDSYNTLNLITSYFHSDRPEDAINILKKHYNEFRNEEFDYMVATLAEARKVYDDYDVYGNMPEDLRNTLDSFVLSRNVSLAKSLSMIDDLVFEEQKGEYIFSPKNFPSVFILNRYEIVSFVETFDSQKRFALQLSLKNGHILIVSTDDFVWEPIEEKNIKIHGLPDLVTQHDFISILETLENIEKNENLDSNFALLQQAKSYCNGARAVGGQVTVLYEKILRIEKDLGF